MLASVRCSSKTTPKQSQLNLYSTPLILTPVKYFRSRQSESPNHVDPFFSFGLYLTLNMPSSIR